MLFSPRVSLLSLAIALALATLGHGTRARAELAAPNAERAEPAKRTGFAVTLGLGQWALGGGNVAVQGNIGRLALEYSHGWGVHVSAIGFFQNPIGDFRESGTTLGFGLHWQYFWLI